jgi:hypothetical protein
VQKILSNNTVKAPARFED